MAKPKKEKNEKIPNISIEEFESQETDYETIEEEKEIVEERVIELNEEKHKTFLRLAKSRTQKILDALKILGNCSNKSTYAYTKLEIEKIFDSIFDTVEKTQLKFRAAATPQKEVFEF